MLSIALLASCGGSGSSGNNSSPTDPPVNPPGNTDYSGSASITQGLATTTVSNLLSSGIRAAGVGSIDDNSGTSWIVPAETNVQNANMPVASDLHIIYIAGHAGISIPKMQIATDRSQITGISVRAHNNGQRTGPAGNTSPGKRDEIFDAFYSLLTGIDLKNFTVFYSNTR